MSHPSVPALLTLPVVDLPRFETLTAAVQSTANSLRERTHGCIQCKSYAPDTVAFITRNSLIHTIHPATCALCRTKGAYYTLGRSSLKPNTQETMNAINRICILITENLKGLPRKAYGWKPCCYEGHRKIRSCIFTKFYTDQNSL